MADLPQVHVEFEPGCPDCGLSSLEGMPRALPDVGDELDWRARDFDGFRQLMLEELVARVPERARWTAADLEVALVEVLASELDWLSDMADRVHAEGFLESARQPESLRRLLAVIDYDAARQAFLAKRISVDPATDRAAADAAVDDLFRDDPFAMEAARRAGPRALRERRRMVTADDYAERLHTHPLLLRAAAKTLWGGSWPVVELAVLPHAELTLDAPLPAAARAQAAAFLTPLDIAVPIWTSDTTLREVLLHFIDAERMIGQDVRLVPARFAGVLVEATLGIQPDFYRSEVRRAVRAALGPAGFFRIDRLALGAAIYASDLIALAMSVEGVAFVTLTRFKRVGARFLDQAVAGGRIGFASHEIAACDDDPARPARGGLVLSFVGGRQG